MTVAADRIARRAHAAAVDRRPLLVTGSHRSGTTWVGRMLHLSGETGYLHEPFNPRRRPGWTGDRIPYWYLYVCEDNERFYAPIVDDVLAFRYPLRLNLTRVEGLRAVANLVTDVSRSVVYRVRRPRPLLKDPLALFSAPWLADRYDAQVVVTIRHPAAFVASIKRLNWRFRFRSWLAQDLLLRDLLGPFEEEMHRCWSQDADIVDQGIVMWKVLHHTIDRFRAQRPSWLFVRHEDLASDPVGGFERLYEQLGLGWSARVAGAIARHSSSGSRIEAALRRHQSVKRASGETVSTWKRSLSPDEIARVRAGVGDGAAAFYPDTEW